MLPTHKSLLLVIPNCKHMQSHHLFFIWISGSKLFPFHSIAPGREKDAHTFFLVLHSKELQVVCCLLQLSVHWHKLLQPALFLNECWNSAEFQSIQYANYCQEQDTTSGLSQGPSRQKGGNCTYHFVQKEGWSNFICRYCVRFDRLSSKRC